MENAAPVAAEAPSQPRRRSPLVRFLIGRNMTFTLVRAFIWIILFGITFKFVLLGIRVTGQSMEPTYRSGQIKFVNRLAYRKAPPQRFDVVAVASPTIKNVLILKRVLGLPGETIGLRGGIIFVNGEPLKEPYVKGKTSFRLRQDRTLQPREYFVIGDNRDVTDAFLVYENQIVGRVLGSSQ